MEKNKTFVFIIFMIIIFYAVPAVFTLLLYCGVMPQNFYLSVEDTVFETYKNCVVIIPELGFAIYFVLIGAGAFLLGVVSKSGLNVFLACIITAVVAIPQAWDLRYADEGAGIISALTIVIPTGICALMGFFGYELHN